MAGSVGINAPKKMGIAVLLAICLGPIGVYYASITGFVAGCILAFFGFLALAVEFEVGAVILSALWPLSVVMAVRGVRQHNLNAS